MNRADAQKALAEQAYWLPTRKDLVASRVGYPQRATDMGVFLAEINRTPAETYATNGAPAFSPAAKLVVVPQFAALLAGRQDTATTVRNIKSGVAEMVAKSGS